MSNLVLPNDDGIRLSSDPSKCFYCNQSVGSPHQADCVCLHKKVKVRFTIELEIEEPASWQASDINFRYNDSSWCASNFLGLLRESFDEMDKAGSCPCGSFSAEYMHDVDSTPCSKEAIPTPKPNRKPSDS